MPSRLSQRLLPAPGAASSSAGHRSALDWVRLRLRWPLPPDTPSWPILCPDVRFGAHDRSFVLDAYDAFLRDPDVASDLRPDVVIRTGAIPTSKALQRFLAESTPAEHVLIDPGAPRDPDHLATTHLRADAAATFAEISDMLETASCCARRQLA